MEELYGTVIWLKLEQGISDRLLLLVRLHNFIVQTNFFGFLKVQKFPDLIIDSLFQILLCLLHIQSVCQESATELRGQITIEE